MKRGFLLLLFLIPSVFAADEFSILFHSSAHNATIDLTKYLDPSGHYYASLSENVHIQINQLNKTAHIFAKPGWLGSEVITFRTAGSISRILNKTELDRFFPEVPHYFYFVEISNVSLDEILESSLDDSLEKYVNEINRERVEDIHTEISEDEIHVGINDVILDVSTDTPEIVLRIAYAEDTKPPEMSDESNLVTYLVIFFSVLGVLLIVAIILSYLSSKTITIKEPTTKRKKSYLDSLTNLEKKLNKGVFKGATHDYVSLERDFLTEKFGLSSNSRIKDIVVRVRASSLSSAIKKAVLQHLNSILIHIFNRREDLARIYGLNDLSKKDLLRFIKNSKRLAKKL